MDNARAGFPEDNEAFFFLGSLLNIPCFGFLGYGGVFYRGGHAILPPGDIFVGIPYWDVGLIG